MFRCVRWLIPLSFQNEFRQVNVLGDRIGITKQKTLRNLRNENKKLPPLPVIRFNLTRGALRRITP